MLTYTEFSGSPYQTGLALGKFGATAVNHYLTSSAAWESVMQWHGSDESLAMQELVQKHHPYIWDELQGLARGLELPAEDVFLWNCRGDLCSIAPDGCTTVMQVTPDGPRLTHNEDGDPGFRGHCGIAEFIVDHRPAFTSFIYPGSLPGHTFAVTENGLAMTVNNVRSRDNTTGIPRMVLTRALLNAADLSSAVNLLSNAPRAGGFHLALAQRGGSALLSIEFSSRGLSVQPVKEATLHANHLIHDDMRDLPQIITDSSCHRQENGTAQLHQPDSADPLLILADQTNPNYPIYRDSPDDSDMENTLATVDIHVGNEHIQWDIYAHPKQAAQFSLRDTKRSTSHS